MGRKKRSALIAAAWMSLGGGLLLLNAGCAAHGPASIVPLSALYADCRTATTSTPVDGFNADLFWNDSSAPQKAVILLGGSEGGKGWSQDQPRVKQLVDEGYFVISLAYFAADGLPSHLRRIPLEYFGGVFNWLAARKGIVADEYAVVGASRGAELALLLAGRYPQITCVVALAPSSVVFPGPPTSLWDALAGQHSAWACDGQEVPFVPMPYSFTTLKGLLTGQRTRMFEKALWNAPAVPAAALPVEKAHAPLLLVSFTHDQIWPSTEMAAQIMDRLDGTGFPSPHQHIAYETRHCDCAPGPCWSTVTSFLREHFKDSRRQLAVPAADQRGIRSRSWSREGYMMLVPSTVAPF